jgi:hypothetical protein
MQGARDLGWLDSIFDVTDVHPTQVVSMANSDVLMSYVEFGGNAPGGRGWCAILDIFAMFILEWNYVHTHRSI